MQHYAAFHLGLRCLQKYSFRGFPEYKVWLGELTVRHDHSCCLGCKATKHTILFAKLGNKVHKQVRVQTAFILTNRKRVNCRESVIDWSNFLRTKNNNTKLLSTFIFNKFDFYPTISCSVQSSIRAAVVKSLHTW